MEKEKLNEEAAPNNNLSPKTIKSSKQFEAIDHEFSEELSDGGERNQIIKNQRLNK
ncbi:hypothetical protein [Neobacillus sp. LXY-4]|uniref:hypothetical protein n=1 Tax=Neobacillus sp. LXY-4 TaxID=3379826 RepID=UPI003EE09C63